ncbi:acetyl-CoA carboxylase biotin carboxylase subunit family protein [Streptomyces fuscichromogenes]|uniref:ATP-grasp domain-containing protein n=1 Tax=Streptomyces fuscichromogenes TaxID=1324013 RepID=UPI0037FCAA6D
MHVLIMQRPGSAARYDHWIKAAAPQTRITLLTSADTDRPVDDLAAGVRRVVVDDYGSPATTAELLRLCAADRPDRIFVNSEDDVLRAAEARTLFGIPGIDSATALRFRDKVAMKDLFDGLPVPAVPHREVRCCADLYAAQEELGTIVVKPRDGAGSAGVRILSDGPAVRQACLDDPGLLTALHGGGLMAERYIESTVHHVDVLVDGGTALLVSPSRYLSAPHRFRTDNLASVMLDGGSPRAKLLTDTAERFVAGLPEGHGVHVLHMEFLEDASGAFFAGEVACRTGGALIKNAVRHTYGVDLSRAACLLSVGLRTEPAEPGRGAAPTGWLLWTGGPRPRVPAHRPDWLVEFSAPQHPQHPERQDAPVDAVDGKARFLVEGVDEEELEHRLGALCRRG